MYEGASSGRMRWPLPIGWGTSPRRPLGPRATHLAHGNWAAGGPGWRACHARPLRAARCQTM